VINSSLKPRELIANFDRYGIHPTYIDNLVFPVSLSAQTVILMLNKRLEELGVTSYLNEKVLDYQKVNNQYHIKTDKQIHVFDKIIFASGGKAYPQLGTDGGVLEVLRQHDYLIETLSPSLCPLKVKENTKKISGQRVKCLVSLYNKGQLYYAEEGEVLFKDDGISGIVILNMSQKINEIKDKSNIKVVLNLVPDKKIIKKEQYEEYVHPKLASYLLDNNLDINALTYTFKNFYDYNIAEVSHGGLSLKEITNNLESKKEKGLYFAGELLDIDGMCGGFNLMFAFASGETIAKAIK
jgi:predicted Rossmann fold flavoprotein